MRFLVTGSDGFIGRNLCRALRMQGHEAAGFDLKSGNDIRNAESILNAAHGASGIFHLAAIASVQESINDPQGTFETNVMGTRNVLAAARAAGNIPVVYASSAAVYGDNPNIPLGEDETPRPLSPYARHKLQNESDANEAGALYGLPTMGLRFFNIYGAGQDPTSPYSGVISIFHERLKNHKPITLYGDGLQTRDFVAVSDAVGAMIFVHTHASHDAPVVNVCTGLQTSLLHLAAVMGDIVGGLPELQHQPARSGDIRYSCGNPARLIKLGYANRTRLHDGLRCISDPTDIE